MHPEPTVAGNAIMTVRINDVVKMTGLSRAEIYRLLLAGNLKAVKYGRTVLIFVDSVRDWLNSLPPATFHDPRCCDIEEPSRDHG